MSDDGELVDGEVLLARVWVGCGEGRSLVARNVRRKDGTVSTTWLVPPDSIKTVLWIEAVTPLATEPSAS
jgi:hypothetical protein